MQQNRKSNQSFDEKIQQVLEELGMVENYMKHTQAQDKYKQLIANQNDSKKAECFIFSPRTDKVSLIPLYDIHNGLKGCNEDKLDAFLRLILDTEDMYTFLGGDVCEVATKQSPGNGQQDEKLHTGEQRRQVTDKLKPLAVAGKILFGVPGNHEMRGHRFNEDNPMMEICYDLDIPYCGYGAFFTMKVGDVEYKVVAHHGNGSMTSPAGAATSAAKPSKVAMADCYITGHTHKRMAYDEIIYDIVGDKVVPIRRVYVVGGSLVNYLGMYPEEKLLQPNVTGFTMITFESKYKYISVML